MRQYPDMTNLFNAMEQRKTRPPQWLRVRDLPVNEQAVFEHWLFTQTRPIIEGAPDNKQDGYYLHDYELWKSQGMPLEQQRATWD